MQEAVAGHTTKAPMHRQPPMQKIPDRLAASDFLAAVLEKQAVERIAMTPLAAPQSAHSQLAI
jgi:hypothetical protein